MIDALIFDSGVGGLSVSAAIRRRLPELALGYVCDNAAMPYGTKRGTKGDAWLVARIVAVCERACDLAQPRALVVACNTASTLALEALRHRLSIPVVGTVPAIKPAVELSQRRVIGLLATSATVQRPYLDRLIETFAVDCRVIRVAADSLVMEAERLLKGLAVDEARLREAVEPLRAESDLDVVVLGCTHFPLLRGWLEPLMPDVHWLDSGDAIARRLAVVLADGATVSRSASAAIFSPSWASAASAGGLAVALNGFGYSSPLDLGMPFRQPLTIALGDSP